MSPTRKEIKPQNVITELYGKVRELERQIDQLRISQQNPTVPLFTSSAIRVSPIEGQIYYTTDQGKLNVYYAGAPRAVILS